MLIWAFAFYCGSGGWPDWSKVGRPPTLHDIRDSFSLHVFAVYVGWWVFQAALHLIVPGQELRGVTLRDGSSLKYRVNGKFSSCGLRAAYLSLDRPPCGARTGHGYGARGI